MPLPALHRSEIPLNEKLAWSVRDTALATGLSQRTIQGLIKTGKLPASRVGRRVLLDPAVVKAALLGRK
jgi:excisionase family DNA binding protein